MIDRIGVYVTESGDKAFITSSDGYRRCYGYLQDSPERDLSWYTESGQVRNGMATGNKIVAMLREPLPDGAKEDGERAQRNARKNHIDRL